MHEIKTREPKPKQGNFPSHFKITLLSFLVCTAALSIALYFYAGFTSSQAASVISKQVFSQAFINQDKIPVTKPGPFTIDELQDKLSSFSVSDSFSEIGNYPLGSHEKDILNVTLSLVEAEGIHVGFVMLDLNTGYGISYNADEEFYSASSIKGPYIASLAAANPDSIYNWGESMYATVHDSNTEEYIFLRSSYGHEPLVAWCEDAGVESFLDDEWYPWCTSRTLAKLWLTNYKYFQTGSEDAEEVMSWFGSTYHSPISENLEAKYIVCSKAGWIAEDGYSATVDAGVVYAGDNPYLMIIMTDAPKDFEMLSALVKVLDDLHDYMNRRPG